MHKILRRGANFKQVTYCFKNINDTSALSEELVQLQSSALSFAKEKLLPYAAEWDRNHYFPKETLREAAQQGYAGLYISSDYGIFMVFKNKKIKIGGCGLDRLSTSVVFEALSYGCIASTAYLTINNMCGGMLDLYGSEEQKQKWLTKLTQLELFSSYCLTESNSGSDAKAMKTSAKMLKKKRMEMISLQMALSASQLEVLLVICNTTINIEQLFSYVCYRGEPNILYCCGEGDQGYIFILFQLQKKGLTFGKLEEKMGWRSSPTAMLSFQDCRVPKSNLVGNLGDGFKFAMKALDGGRINIASCSLGGAALAFDTAQQYMTERKQFGKRLSEFQYLQFKLADMATHLTSSRLMVRNAARLIDQDHEVFIVSTLQYEDKTLYSAMAKRYATDACSLIANEALQIHGGYGYLSDYPLERIVRDLRVNQILEGTNEIMRLIISRKLFI